ncbi:MAG: hypothetical protein K0S53_3124 [Bacteroidetes bacterium]|nr:hypothetical protein [Bacteroidota bacterium]
MKKIAILFIFLISAPNVKAQFVTVPDANFVTWLQTIYPLCMNGNQIDTTCPNIINATAINITNLNLSDLTGIKYFKNLQVLNCQNNQITNLTSLPNSITHLLCSGNQSLTAINLPSSLYKLECMWCQLTSLPSLPSSLRILNCGDNQLTSLPLLPILLESLGCRGNQITTLPNLPNSLISLGCEINQLSSLPPLPNNLEVLDCYDNQITSLPMLPAQLFILSCAHNLLTNLPVLPNTISEISCENNFISNMPILPTGLTLLRCSHNQLTSLPPLPNTIVQLFCDSNQINNIPAFPNSLDELNCSNNFINCFPFFPAMSIIDISNNPNNCLPNYIPTMDANTLSFPLCNAGISNGCPNAQGIVGNIYKDINSNCVKNNGEIGIKNIRVKIYDNNSNLIGQTYSATNGIYGFPQNGNSYSILIDTLYLPYTSSCIYPGLDSSFTVSQLDTNINFALINKPGFDLGIQSINVNGTVFPGVPHAIVVNAGDFAHWYNFNTTAGVNGTVTFSIIGPVTYIGSAVGSLTPTVSGNVYTYNVSDFGTINNTSDFKLIFQTDTIAQAGDSICVHATINPVNGDNNITNNSYTYCYQVVNSYDPNIKEVYPVDVMPGYNDWLTYTIHFQNTGNAPAHNIRLADTLDAMLDLESFQVINYSHQNIIDLTGDILNIRFPNIQLPDSASNPIGSIGFIQYRLKPKTTWTPPYQIKNTAYIYFDYNSPIITNTTINKFTQIVSVKENSKEPLATIYPNPTSGIFTIELASNEKQTIQVIDITGNTVTSQVIENGKTTVNTSDLAAGIYNIQIKGNGVLMNKKLVIVK